MYIFAFNTFSCLFYSFLLTRDGFKNHCNMKPVVVFQSLSKFGMFTFVVSYTMFFVVFFTLTGGANKIFRFLVGEEERRNFQRKGGRITLE